MPQISDPDGILGKSDSSMDGAGGYDMAELQQAHETLSAHKGDEKGYDKVDPIRVQVSDNPVVREQEFEARVVLIEYDVNDEIVSVELL